MLALLWLNSEAFGNDIDFVRQIQPLLKKHCYQCHGPNVQEAGLRLDVKRRALAGGESGKVVVPGSASKSQLFKLISANEMPPPEEAAPLAEPAVALIRAWIDAGAVWPDGVDPVTKDTKLWSFEPVRRPTVPSVEQTNWVANPIDAFVLDKLEAAGMKPAPPVEPRAWIRRASFDLLGLPPTPEEVGRFESITNQGSKIAREVDRLIASPRYGERWARHWLDLVRYADSNGYETDFDKPMAWKYRDYIIRALNDATPYDRFILEQLAGDELDGAASETVIATGFYRVGLWDAERGASAQPSEKVAERFNELDDMVSTTTQVFLGLTLGCARCHDHKFDPLTSRDYYSLVSVFSPLTRPRKGRTELTRPAVPPREMEEWNEADARVAKLRDRIKSLESPLRAGLVNSGETKLPADAVAALKTAPDHRNEQQKQLVQRFASSLDREVTAALRKKELAEKFVSEHDLRQISDARSEIARLESQFDYPQGYFLFEPPGTVPVTHLLKRGNPKQPGAVVHPAVPVAVGKQAGQEPPTFDAPDSFTSRRRISLARWIADPDNPLTARVLVNRVWQYHFGQALVHTPSDFGRQGATPTHPELLDWLAHWFVHDADWSLKKLHRLIMTSNTYGMSKRRHDRFAEIDPDNELLWRFPYRRLEVESIRDSMLTVSGQLNGPLYGPAMFPHIPADARESGYDPSKVWRDFDERDASRRSIYAYVKRTLVVPFFDTLDFCDTTHSAERRDITTVAPQALELLNGEFVNRQARHFADRLIRKTGDDIEQQIDRAYWLALGRSPTTAEQQALMAFWSDERVELSDRDALAQVCRVIFNLNEFVYTD
jgi:hypothetical protein